MANLGDNANEGLFSRVLNPLVQRYQKRQTRMQAKAKHSADFERQVISEPYRISEEARQRAYLESQEDVTTTTTNPQADLDARIASIDSVLLTSRRLQRREQLQALLGNGELTPSDKYALVQDFMSAERANLSLPAGIDTPDEYISGVVKSYAPADIPDLDATFSDPDAAKLHTAWEEVTAARSAERKRNAVVGGTVGVGLAAAALAFAAYTGVFSPSAKPATTTAANASAAYTFTPKAAPVAVAPTAAPAPQQPAAAVTPAPNLESAVKAASATATANAAAAAKPDYITSGSFSGKRVGYTWSQPNGDIKAVQGKRKTIAASDDATKMWFGVYEPSVDKDANGHYALRIKVRLSDEAKAIADREGYTPIIHNPATHHVVTGSLDDQLSVPISEQQAKAYAANHALPDVNLSVGYLAKEGSRLRITTKSSMKGFGPKDIAPAPQPSKPYVAPQAPKAEAPAPYIGPKAPTAQAPAPADVPTEIVTEPAPFAPAAEPAPEQPAPTVQPEPVAAAQPQSVITPVGWKPPMQREGAFTIGLGYLTGKGEIKQQTPNPLATDYQSAKPRTGLELRLTAEGKATQERWDEQAKKLVPSYDVFGKVEGTVTGTKETLETNNSNITLDGDKTMYTGAVRAQIGADKIIPVGNDSTITVGPGISGIFEYDKQSGQFVATNPANGVSRPKDLEGRTILFAGGVGGQAGFHLGDKLDLGLSAYFGQSSLDAVTKFRGLFAQYGAQLGVGPVSAEYLHEQHRLNSGGVAYDLDLDRLIGKVKLDDKGKYSIFLEGFQSKAQTTNGPYGDTAKDKGGAVGLSIKFP